MYAAQSITKTDVRENTGNLGPTQVKCQLLNHDIFLNEFPTYFGKCPNLIYDISFSSNQ